MDLFCLRGRDLLKQLADEVSHHIAQGESREKALMLVQFSFRHWIFFLPSYSSFCHYVNDIYPELPTR
jgi:hypothetical protein